MARQYPKHTHHRRLTLGLVLSLALILGSTGLILGGRYARDQRLLSQQERAQQVLATDPVWGDGQHREKPHGMALKAYVEWEQSYTVAAHYPELTEQPGISQSLRQMVSDTVKAFHELVEQDQRAGVFNAEWGYELNMSFEPFTSGDRYISFLFDQNLFTGGAHYITTYQSKTYDRATGKQIAFNDLFTDRAAALALLSRLAKENLLADARVQQMGIDADDEMLNQGIAPNPENFDLFVVGQGALTIAFEDCQIGPHALGPMRVTLSAEALREVLSPLGKAALSGVDLETFSDATPGPTVTPEMDPPSVTPAPSATPEPSQTPDATATPPPTEEPAQTPEPTAEATPEPDGQAPYARGERIEVAEGDKVVALTFDDGPDGKYTMQILDALEQYGGKATFFLLGDCVKYYPEPIQRADAMGCEIGNHTYGHKRLDKQDDAGLNDQVGSLDEAVRQVIGKYPYRVRPPFGAGAKALKSRLNRPIALWTVDPEDWKVRNADQVYDHVMSHVKDGSVVLMHDIYPESADAAARIIRDLTEQGYKLVTLDQLAELRGHGAGG